MNKIKIEDQQVEHQSHLPDNKEIQNFLYHKKREGKSHNSRTNTHMQNQDENHNRSASKGNSNDDRRNIGSFIPQVEKGNIIECAKNITCMSKGK